MIKCACDRCQADIKKPSDIKRVKLFADVDDEAIKLLRDMDLCERCYEKIHYMVYDFITFKEKSNG